LVPSFVKPAAVIIWMSEILVQICTRCAGIFQILSLASMEPERKNRSS
jgi:hypothetical protein